VWKIFVVVSSLIIILSCTPAPRYRSIRVVKPQKEQIQPAPGERPPIGTKYQGIASYYADDFHGKKTANGEIYDMYGLTAAHKTLPFNTWLEVTNLTNGRTVIVRVNDRGPFIGDRIIDLSYGAAKELRMVGKGIQEVVIIVIK
jgi:rare lipoprotein A (peptidoglycan hydrolase)